ncbi:MAG: ATP-binding protein [Ruminococcus sp.]|nr:ATP-binding protein [Ruminococcus sp.]
MLYSENVYDKARAELTRRHSNADALYNEHAEVIKQNAPLIYESEQRIRKTFFNVVASYLSNGADGFERIEEDNLKAQSELRAQLKAHGYPEDYLDVKYYCDKCRDTGSVGGMTCECMRELLKRFSAQELNEKSSICPERFEDVRLDIYQNDDVKDKMQKVIAYLESYCNKFDAEGDNESLFLVGSTGTGKTFLSSCIASALNAKGVMVSFGTAFEQLKRCEDEHFGRASGDSMQTMINADLLIIDDLGSEFHSKFSEAALYNIINSRMNMHKATVVSTNLNSQELKSIYNDRITSRLMGAFTPILFHGGDVRLSLKKRSLGQ